MRSRPLGFLSLHLHSPNTELDALWCPLAINQTLLLTDLPLTFNVKYLYWNSAWSGFLIMCRLTTPDLKEPSTYSKDQHMFLTVDLLSIWKHHTLKCMSRWSYPSLSLRSVDLCFDLQRSSNKNRCALAYIRNWPCPCPFVRSWLSKSSDLLS